MQEKYDSREDTKGHISRVAGIIQLFRNKLKDRARVHDASKLETPEKEVFDRVTPQLKQLEYGSIEYKEALAEMGPALQHHYKANSHHPEHYVNGIDGMDLFDIMEMYADWKAASERHENGDFAESLEINKKRFNISDQLHCIFKNTEKTMERTGWPRINTKEMIFGGGETLVYAESVDDTTTISISYHNGGSTYTVTEPGWRYIHKLLIHMEENGEGEMVWGSPQFAPARTDEEQ